MGLAMDYNTFEPPSTLHTLVKCFWTLKSNIGDKLEKQRIVPDGCMEMIFHFGDPYKQYLSDGSVIIQPRCFVFGQITSPLDIEPTGRTGIFAVRFHPESFMPFSTKPVHEMENKAVSLVELYGEDGLRFEQEILAAKTTEERIEICETFLMGRLSTPEAMDRIVKSSVETILSLNGNLSVEELTQNLNVNRRQLERRFSSVIGISPKQLARIVRLQATIKMLLNGQFTSLTAVAYEGDFYDQAHFIKDFKAFTGMSPKKFYADNFKMSSLFYGTE
jgi:AraC-like DNA-binding protein